MRAQNLETCLLLLPEMSPEKKLFPEHCLPFQVFFVHYRKYPNTAPRVLPAKDQDRIPRSCSPLTLGHYIKGVSIQLVARYQDHVPAHGHRHLSPGQKMKQTAKPTNTRFEFRSVSKTKRTNFQYPLESHTSGYSRFVA